MPRASFALVGMRLSGEEKHLLQALFELGESTAEQLAAKAKLDLQVVEGLLRELSRRRYVAEIVETDRTTYRAVLPELEAERIPWRRPIPPGTVLGQ